MDCGARECTSSISQRNSGSRAEWLGETEQERVRIIREWVQMNSRQRGACVDRREEKGAEVAGQIEQVLDGLVVNHNEGRTEHTRRGIRRLCGRQALLDMLKKAERERQSELQGLLEHRAVTKFAHRNRIQVSCYQILTFSICMNLVYILFDCILSINVNNTMYNP
jgi:hypothetical protein